MKVISILVVSRERPKLLIECVKSAYAMARHPGRVEVVVLLDDDDKTADEFVDYAERFLLHLPVKILKVPRSIWHCRDYTNVAASASSGSIVWGLNDECEIVTPYWDVILEGEIESKLVGRKNRALYVCMDDSTHFAKGMIETHGCCFPAVTREAIFRMGGLLPKEIHSWGADIALWKIFKDAGEDMILRLPQLKTLHKSPHNGDRPVDSTAEHVRTISKIDRLSPEQHDRYVRLLCQSQA